MKKLIIIFFFITSVIQAQTTYYVSEGGGGDTLATVDEVNALTLVPGDSILFHRGDVFTINHRSTPDYDSVVTYGKHLMVDVSGTALNRIVFGAYGEGARPVINGRHEIPGSQTEGSWTEVATNIWRMYASIYLADGYVGRGRVWLDGVEAKHANSTTTPTATEKWTHGTSDHYLYLYSVGNPATVYSKIEDQGWSNYCFLIYNADYITVRELNLGGCNHTLGIHYSSNIVVDSCDIGWNTGMQGIFVAGDATGSDNGEIKYCTLATNDTLTDSWNVQNTEDGIYLNDGVHTWSIHHNTFSNWGHSSFSIYLNDISRTMTDIKFYNNTLSGSDIDYSRGFLYNVINSEATLGDNSGNEIYNNFFYDFPIQCQISGDGLKFYNNIIDGVRGNSYRTDIAACGLDISGFHGWAKNNEIYNNVIANSRDFGLRMFGDPGNTREVGQNLIKNNIFYNNHTLTNSDGYVNVQLYVETSVYYPTMEDNTYQNNLFFSSATGSTIVLRERNNVAVPVATFNSYNGWDSNVIGNNIAGSPTFTDSANANYLLRDYNLLVGSPAIAAGLGVGLTLDKAGNAWNPTPSIGAYEYDSDPPDPPGLPEITTGAVTYTAVYANVASSITSNGGGTITSRGICWSTSANPTTLDKKTVYTGAEGSNFVDVLRGLSGGTTYHVRAYVTNESGTAYGSDVSFTTPVHSNVVQAGKILKYNGKTVIVK